MVIQSAFNNGEFDIFRAANSLLKPIPGSRFGNSFSEIFDNQAKEVTKKAEEKTGEILEDKTGTKKEEKKKFGGELPDISKILNKNNETRNNHELQRTYALLEKFKDSKRFEERDLSKGPRQQALNNIQGFPGHPFIQPMHDHGQRKRMTKSQLLSVWDKFSPTVTEFASKRSVRIDIPLVNDIQALVLRLNPDRSITASMLGSKEMAKLVKDNKDKLDRNLRHHHLSLKEFNTYNTELALNNESGTKRQKKKAKENKKSDIDLIGG